MTKNSQTPPKDMNPEFTVHVLSQRGIEKAGEIAELFNNLLFALSELCPQKTREFSIVKTKLEEACFFSKKAMSGSPENWKSNEESKAA